MKAELKTEKDGDVLSIYSSEEAFLKNQPVIEDVESLQTDFMKAHKRAIFFDSGMVLHVQVQGLAKHSLFMKADEPILKVTFSLADPFSTSVSLGGDRQIMKAETYNVFYIPEPEGYWHINEGEQYDTVELVLSGSQTLTWLAKYGPHLTSLKQSIEANTYYQLYENNVIIPPQLLELIRQMLSYNEHAEWKRLILEKTTLAVMMEVLGKRKGEVSVAENIKTMLELNFKKTPTMAELCRFFGINKKLIQQKFKQQYNSTIFEYAHTLRMEKAREELLKGKTVKEVGFMLSYQNTSHFSRAYKKHWRLSPRYQVTDGQAGLA